MASGAAIKQSDEQQRLEMIAFATIGAMTAILIAAYWNSLGSAATYWENPKYSHGYLVPLFTLVLLWLRREPLRQATSWESWAGLGMLAAGLGIRLLATYFPNITPEMSSFVLCLAGLVMMVGGWSALKWAGPAVAFLIFMFPLPGFLDNGLLKPLQRIATLSSTYCLQTLGVPSYAEGNTIFINELQMGVVEQCSGLRMLTIFVALSVAITLVTQRPLWERIVIVVSAVPIALAVNIVRITVTGILHLTVGQELADKVFHDLAGWVMMPMALGMMYVEFQLLSHMIIEDSHKGPIAIGAGPQRAPRPQPPQPPKQAKQPTGV